MAWTRRKVIKTGLWSIFGVLPLDTFWIEHFFIEINEFFLPDYAKEKSDIKLVQLSDLHLHQVNYQLRRLAEKLNNLKPDLILITGDVIDDSKNLNHLNEFLQLIDHPLKKVAITGNWEYWGNINLNELRNIYANHNCDLLINESKQYTFRGKSLSITGVDDYIGGNTDIVQALKSYQESNFHIVLNHCPEYSDTISALVTQPINLILSGHVHGGQVNLFGWTPFKPPGSGRYLKGWYEINSKKMYVSRGIGTSILPVRFMSRAEIAIFNLAD
jgi:hypothetical protein